MRTCRKCGETKPIAEFDKRADTGGYGTECRACRRLRQRTAVTTSRTKWFVGNPEPLRCRRCGELKPWTEFPRRGRDSNHVQVWCKECFAAYKAERHQRKHVVEMQRIRRNHERRVGEHRALIVAHLMTHPCVDCGEADPVVLEFDHVRGEKLADVSQMVTAGYPWAKIEVEIAKCEVRCANCHRRVTVKRRLSQTSISESIWIYGDPGGA